MKKNWMVSIRHEFWEFEAGRPVRLLTAFIEDEQGSGSEVVIGKQGIPPDHFEATLSAYATAVRFFGGDLDDFIDLAGVTLAEAVAMGYDEDMFTKEKEGN